MHCSAWPARSAQGASLYTSLPLPPRAKPMTKNLAPARTAPWRVLLVLLMAVITLLALMPVPPKAAGVGWDKANHLLAFGALAVCAVFGFRGRRTALWLVLAALAAYGGLIELLQQLVPNREAEWADLLADLVGIVLGALLAWAWLRRGAAAA
jgi:VanZ family protein